LPNLVSAVADAMKAPFLDGGRDLKGMDCWGLVHYIALNGFGMNLPDFRIGCENDKKIYFQFLERTKEEFYKIEEKDIKAGDFIALNMLPETPSIVHHFGIFINSKQYIHTLKDQGPQITKLSDFKYKYRIRGFHRWDSTFQNSAR